VEKNGITFIPNNSLENSSQISDQENKKYSILILDDDPNFGEFLSIFLKLNGFIVDLVENPVQFWSILNHKAIDVIFLDYRLPGTNGIQILSDMADKKIRIPVLMMTGEGDERIAAQAIKKGAFDYLVKGDNYLPNLTGLIHKAIRVNQLQQSVEASMEKIRFQATMLRNMRDAVVVWDTNGIITFWNPSAEMLFGYSADEQTGKNVWEGYLNHFSPTLSAYDLMNTDNLETERLYTSPSEKNIWISSRITPIHLENDETKIIGYMDVSRNITTQIEEQKELKESRRFIQQILDTTPNFLFIYDILQMKCVFCNARSHEILGYSLEEKQIQGHSIPFDFVHPEDRSDLKNYFSAFTNMKEGEVREITFRMRDINRQWHFLDCYATPFLFDSENHPTQIIGTAQDVTERKQMEEKILQAQAYLAESTRLSAIGELASGVAHQISNPLTTIIAEAQMLMQQIEKDHPFSESISAIEKAGWRAQSVIKQLLEYSQPPSETIVPVDLNQTIMQGLTLVGDNLKNVGIELIVSLRDRIPKVHAVPQRLVHVWVYLLLHSFHLLKAQVDGKIKINSDYDHPNNQVIIEISDNNKIIQQDHINTLFEPVLLPTSSNMGTGMELSICREIVRQFGGQISAAWHENWTTIRVNLPGE